MEQKGDKILVVLKVLEVELDVLEIVDVELVVEDCFFSQKLAN